jgi:hypothetical protein
VKNIWKHISSSVVAPALGKGARISDENFVRRAIGPLHASPPHQLTSEIRGKTAHQYFFLEFSLPLGAIGRFVQCPPQRVWNQNFHFVSPAHAFPLLYAEYRENLICQLYDVKNVSTFS